MSELIVCNYCKYAATKLYADKEGKIIEIRDEDGGKAIYLDGKWDSWFEELTKDCAC